MTGSQWWIIRTGGSSLSDCCSTSRILILGLLVRRHPPLHEFLYLFSRGVNTHTHMARSPHNHAHTHVTITSPLWFLLWTNCCRASEFRGVAHRNHIESTTIVYPISLAVAWWTCRTENGAIVGRKSVNKLTKIYAYPVDQPFSQKNITHWHTQRHSVLPTPEKLTFRYWCVCVEVVGFEYNRRLTTYDESTRCWVVTFRALELGVVDLLES